MPTYEYQCKECRQIFERFESIKAKPKRFIRTECRQCDNRAPVTRLIGAGGGVIFKGSGFYETDYRSDSYKKAAKAEHERTNGKAATEGSDTKKESSDKTTDATTKTETTPKKASKGTAKSDG